MQINADSRKEYYVEYSILYNLRESVLICVLMTIC